MTIIGFRNIDGSAMIQAEQLPKQYGMQKNYEYPRSWQTYHDNGWRYVMAGEPCPDGHVLDYSEIVWDGTNDQWQQVNHYITTAEAEARRAAAEAARIAALAAIYGQAVGQFAGLLANFGLAMPITESEAALAMYTAVKANATLSADSQLCNLVYSQLKLNLTDDDIYAIGKLIGVAE